MGNSLAYFRVCEANPARLICFADLLTVNLQSKFTVIIAREHMFANEKI